LAPVEPVAFAAEINPTGTGLLYSTYLGGFGALHGYGIAVNGSGDAIVTGLGSSAFPTPAPAFFYLPYTGAYVSEQSFAVRISAAAASCTVAISPASQTVYTATLLNFSVAAPSGCTWTTSSDQPWATVAQGASGTGSSVIYIDVTANTTSVGRTANISVGGQTFSITQAPSSCTYSVSPSSFSLGITGGAVSTTLTTAAGCPWSVANSYPNAISTSSGASGTGSGTIVLNVGASAQHNSRTFYVNVGNTQLAITQAGDCTYTVSPATSAQLFLPQSVAVDAAGNIYIADSDNYRVRRVDLNGTISTITGDGFGWYQGDGGPAISAILGPMSLSVDATGRILVADGQNYGVRVLTPFGGPPVLTVQSTHGTFTQGQGATYSVTVSNAQSAGPTSGIVTVSEILPAALSLNSMSGTGWTCTGASCTRSDPLSGGCAYPAIAVDVSASNTAPWQVTNQVIASNGPAIAGGEDLTIVNAATPVLSIVSTHFGNFSPGQQNATYTLTVANGVYAPATNGPVTVTEILPPGLALVSISGTAWSCIGNACTRSDPLSGGATYSPITVTVNVAPSPDSQIVNQVSASGGGSLQANGIDPTTIGVNLCAVTHYGNAGVPDIQETINEALGQAAASHDLNQDGSVNVVDVQIVMDSVLRLGCPIL
jgi:uncharacterized repeat protein (TIGR01451 family)